jgi:hypothetical protein
MWFDDENSPGRRLFVDARGSRRSGYRAYSRLSGRGSRMDRVTMGILIPVAILGVLVLLWLGVKRLGEVLYTENSRYTITHIEIKAGKTITEKKIREYTRIEEGKNIFSFNARKVRDSVLQGSPNIKSMSIVRILPGTVRIEITERDPVARFGSRTSLFAADREGFVFNLGDTALRIEMPVIVGYRSDSLKLGSAVQGQAAMALEALDGCNDPRLCLRVDSIDVSQDGFLSLAMPIGGSVPQDVKLAWKGMGTGTADSRQNLLRKLNLVAQVQQSPEGKRLAKIDVTHEGGKVYGQP